MESYFGQEYYIGVLALILIIGVGAQIVGKHFRIPSILFLLITGLLLGPLGLGYVRPEFFEGAIRPIVEAAVIIIVFEGSIGIDLKTIKKISREATMLVSVGGVITFLGVSLGARYIVGMEWMTAMLVGGILMATGPTVIAPLVRHMKVKRKVGKILELEGVLNDAIAVIVSATIFELIIADVGLGEGIEVIGIEVILQKIVTGFLIGMFGGYLMNHALSLSKIGRQTARLLALAFVMGLYMMSNTMANASGLFAVASCGLVMGTFGSRYIEDIREFKEDLSVILLSVIFILLAAYFNPDDIINLGFRGIGLIIILMFVIRPISVFLSTSISKSLTKKEKLFISMMGPKGVVPASLAVFYTLQIGEQGLIIGLIFIAVILTVFFSGIYGRVLVKKLGLVSMNIIIVGGGNIGRVLAERFSKRGESVSIIEANEGVCESLRKLDVEVICGDATDPGTLKRAGIENTNYLLITTGDDAVNLLVSQIAISKFDLPPQKIIAKVNNPENLKVFEDLGIKAMSPSFSTALIMEDIVGTPDLFSIEVGMEGDLVECEVKNPDVIGKKLSEISLPKDSIVILVKRGDKSYIPDGSFVFEKGDRVTILGGGDHARKAMKVFT
jgi:NhaP-type Na+/H+ or K+/H+ antiporter